jgi:hypothetical protein
MVNRLNTLLLVVCCASVLAACKAKEEPWEETRSINVNAYKTDPENGKQYLQVLYENLGKDTIEQIKYELIKLHGTKADTAIRIIEPPKVFVPGERHIVPRQVGQSPADFDAVAVGKIWVIKKTS